jgi:uncharacterized membrane protein
MENKFISPRPQLRAAARRNLKGNWLTAVLLYLAFYGITLILNLVPKVGPVLNFIISGPLALGLTSCFLNLIRNKPFKIETLFDGFSNFKTAFLTHLLRFIFITLWSLLLVIPGIIAIYRYSMAFYILRDNPKTKPLEAINHSKEMMKGHKSDLFFLQLSFIGWIILGLIPLGLGMLWVLPYMKTATTNFYQELKEKQKTAYSNADQSREEETANNIL